MVKQVERNNSKFRFAALRRVSTEQQEKKGESLRTQRTEIEEAVKRLDGMIVEWYGGQEHAVAGHEKKEIDRLLTNAQKKKFNAFIVTHADRWSRDNEKSKQGLKIFREQGVRFFGGLSVEEVAKTLGVSKRTVESEWTHARAWLRTELDRGTD